ncbi:glycoside hydrolase family 10 protein [Bipolaris zeicola 26-R-13]|uniref:Beta-xylanase n=1 Tax=Cochliobolus carbonum (strain 26-R-13) TaxID=930089 RepID=W6XS43_COCC2|nr:glycoside hydrolase family 10 protein [Bipolaris zeicola 26-R-13]EUC28130.1 glycoside hydrolase family 10 protein [Bipolaris zeicola 26-R-13]
MAFSTNFKVFGITTTTLLLLTAVKASIAIPTTGTTALREEAHKKNITIGSGAINPTYLEDPVFAAVLAEQFNSLHPENEMKWSFINPTPGHYNWDPIDLNITNPKALRAAMTTHFEAIMHRHEGRIDRWDVVTEALKTMGGGLNANDFSRQLGPGYINEAFRTARAASPGAKLYINENQVEVLPCKRQELEDLVFRIVADGVPIDGVALQMHITEVAPVHGVITDMVRFYKALGLQVEIAEMDVHTLNKILQTQIYGAVVKEALEAGITDINFWGFTDKHAHTWVPGAKPLMFDENYKPKGAFYATHSDLEEFVNEC